MKFIDWVKKYSLKNNLEYKEFKTFTTTQYRVKKGSRFIDFWPNGSFRDINGKFHRRGASERGYGADNVNIYSSTQDDGCGYLPAIKKNIKELSSRNPGGQSGVGDQTNKVPK